MKTENRKTEKVRRRKFKMNKLITFVTVTALAVFCLAGCGSTKEKSTPAEDRKELEHANQAAKLVFTTVNAAAADIITDGSGKLVPGFYESDVTAEAPEGDRVLAAVLRALEDNSDTKGEFCYRLENGGKVAFAQFRLGEADYIGQYPDPNVNTDENLKWGTYTPGKATAKGSQSEEGEHLEGAAALKNANTLAKTVYTYASSYIADKLADGASLAALGREHDIPVDSFGGNELDRYIIDELKSRGVTRGRFYFVIEENGTVKKAQFWESDCNYIGQYPDPNTDKDKNIGYGKYETVPGEK